MQDLPRDSLIKVQILDESPQIYGSICHVHLDLLLSVVNEIMVASCLTFELVSVGKIENLRTKLANAK